MNNVNVVRIVELDLSDISHAYKWQSLRQPAKLRKVFTEDPTSNMYTSMTLLI